jgi:VIT1/CCC1 family predicted Fe2+/Mn2+ transporter
MGSFIRRHLDPSDRLGEILFGLIMALGFTAAVRFGRREADNQALFTGIFGCNLAWAIVDGVIFVLTALFERGRRTRVARDVRSAPTEAAALRRIGEEVDGPLLSLTTPEERHQVHLWVLALARRAKPEPPRVRRGDLLGGLAVAVIILVATLPVVVPFLLLSSPNVAVRVSNLVALAELFLLGAWWAKVVGARPLRTATGLTCVALVLVLITICLGG